MELINYFHILTFLKIKSFKEKTGKIKGEITWKTPSLQSALTKFKGSISNNQIAFEEYEIVKGDDCVVVPNNYVGTVSKEKNKKDDGHHFVVRGSVKDSNGDENPFELFFASE